MSGRFVTATVVGPRRARIFLALVDPDKDGEWRRPNIEEPCIRCGKNHDKLWIIRRVLADTFGHFPVFRINGREQLVDGSLPHTVERLPRDAQPVSPEDAAGHWHDDNESHVFGGPNIAKALRESIAAENARGRS